ncbi:MAG TPA: 2-amino-4-hydroxy-6-hydroxymethyldihydropteridine diphosphokinase [Usitatibacteraceae bacterium]|nr:2-amino-4-hydroxy-6-hydroxymethyldihydropteridine diphosphokinase [Usitatibacteraceae bacterium]
MPEVFVAAGSNIRPRTHLRRAVAALAAAYPGLRVSRAWSNAAVGFEGDDFINLVVGFETDDALAKVLERLKSVEEASGRERGAKKWAPRTLDLDLLLYGDLVGQFPGATLPRADLAECAYVLGPLAELAPQLRHPVLGATLGRLWKDFDRSSHTLREVSLDGED